MDKDLLNHLAYEELQKIARSVKHNGQERSTTTLVHEAWLKLKGNDRLSSVSDVHLKAIVAKAMRQILVDYARQRGARKRGGGNIFVSIEEWDGPVAADAEVIAIDSALEELEAVSPRQAAIVENRFFGGFSVAETAAALGVSESVVERDWRAAKAWLKSRIRR